MCSVNRGSLDCERTDQIARNQKMKKIEFNIRPVPRINLPTLISIYLSLSIYLSINGNLGIVHPVLKLLIDSRKPTFFNSSILQFLNQSINQSSRLLGINWSKVPWGQSFRVLGGFLEDSRIRGFSHFSAEINQFKLEQLSTYLPPTTYLPTYLQLPTYLPTYLPTSNNLPTYLPTSNYLPIPTYQYLPSFLPSYLPPTTYLFLPTYFYLPIYLQLPTYLQPS